MLRSTLLLALSGSALAVAEPVIIDDRMLAKSLSDALTEFAESDQGTSADDLRKEVEVAPSKLARNFKRTSGNTDNPHESVYLISSAYNCGKCSKWHLGGIATAWALSHDGLMVSNYHVFEKTKGDAMAVCGFDGTVHRVVKVLAADKANDIAIFQVDAKRLKPLVIGKPAPVGEDVEVISNPQGRFFTHTFGEVSRYHRVGSRNGEKESPFQMSITADYAKGSSGGPVLDSKRNVVGMVTSTQSIYYKSSRGAEPQGPLQMVVKNCVPISAITAMLEGNAEQTATD